MGVVKSAFKIRGGLIISGVTEELPVFCCAGGLPSPLSSTISLAVQPSLGSHCNYQ